MNTPRTPPRDLGLAWALLALGALPLCGAVFWGWQLGQGELGVAALALLWALAQLARGYLPQLRSRSR